VSSYSNNIKNNLNNITHEKVGLWLKKNKQPNDIIMMSYPVGPHFFSKIPAIQKPSNSDPKKEQLEIKEIIDAYQVNLFVDLHHSGPIPNNFRLEKTFHISNEKNESINVSLYRKVSNGNTI